MTPASELVRVDSSRWQELLDRLPHDVYHTAAYHRCPQLVREGDPYLFAYCEGDDVFLWPYLLEAIPDSEYFDVTSVYGYSGPLANGGPDFVRRGWSTLLENWRQQRVVSAFTRFHPVLGNCGLADKFVGVEGTTRLCGTTIALDLSLPNDEQLRRYQKVLRQDVRKIRDLGMRTSLDSNWEHGAEFVRIYRDTMERRGTSSGYFITEPWLAEFRASLGVETSLFVTHYQDRVAVALLVMQHGPFLHAHLTGINPDFAQYSPLKVLLDDVRQWGTEQGFRYFHLGGGLGGRQDSLYHFKRKFSPDEYDFRIGSWILDQDAYRDLSRHVPTDSSFFPAYRCATAVSVE
jgi:hypothetical protein